MNKKILSIFALLSIAALVGLWLASRNEPRKKQIPPANAAESKRPSAVLPSPASAASVSQTSATTAATTPAPKSMWDAPQLVTGNSSEASGRNLPERTGISAAANPNLSELQQGQTIVIPLLEGLEVRGTINLRQNDIGATIRIGGSLLDQNQGSFALAQSSDGISGQVLLREQNTAYLISSLASGEIMIREVPLARVMCEISPRELGPAAAPLENPMRAPPELRSRPLAGAVLYLDFDGAAVQDSHWNSGNAIVAAPSYLNGAEITEVWRRVKEDFWPFAINVTTVESDYTNAAVGRRMRIIITPTDTAEPGSGGVSYLDSFARGGANYSSTIPAWVFNWSIDGIAETISHEAGHTFGLSHDGLINPHEEYYFGHGYSSHLSWGAIMGYSISANVTQWSKGEYPQANNQEDDLAIIAGIQATSLYNSTNNTGYVADDFGNSRGQATSLTISSDALPTQEGQISSAADADFFTFSVAGPKQLTITVTPANAVTKNANLDAEIELQDANGAVLALASPDLDLRAIVFTTVPAGTYYLKVGGAGHAPNPDTFDYGYSNYGSIGQYTLTGSIATVVAPSITANPQGQILYAGTPLSLSATAIGTAPLTYTWKRNQNAVANGGRISGANTASLSITEVTVDDAGSYTLTVSNAAGSVTTAAAVVSVTVPPAPVFIQQPSNVAAIHGNSISLYAYVSSPVAVSYQWYQNGVLIPGATSSWYSKYNVTTADAGNYHVTARNGGGTVSSNTAVVAITLGTPPVIYTQPQGADLYVGQYYGLYVYASSVSPATYQWYRDGAAISGAIYSNHNMSPASIADTGEYTVTITNAAGSVTSSPAFVTVSSTMPPRITYQPYSNNYANLGDSASFSVSAEGTGPLTYQWYFNGTAIPSSNSSYYSISYLTGAHLGEYHVVVSNANGSVTSDAATLDLNPNATSTTYWSEAREVDGIIYFLFKESAKISRYDLASETWLPSWQLVNAPTAFAVTSDAIYIAYGVTIKKYSPTLGAETVFIEGTVSFTWLEVADNLLLTASSGYPYTTMATYNLANGQNVSSHSYIYSLNAGFSYSAVNRRIYGRTTGSSPGDLYSVEVNTDGTLAASAKDTPYHGGYPEGQRTFLLGNGSFVSDEGGVVYGGIDLVTVGSFGIRIRDAISDGANGYCSVNGTKVFRYDDKFRQLGSAQLTMYAARMWRKGDSLIAFAQPTSSAALPAFQKIDIASIQPAPLPPSIFGYAQKITADKLVIDETGVVYVYNKALKQILRWSTAKRAYLPSLPLRSTARYLAYSATNDALYFDNGSTQVLKIDLAAATPTAEPFYSSAQSLLGMQTAGELLVVADPSGAWSSHYVLSAAGDVLDWADWNYPSREYTWSQANRRLYHFRDDSSPNDLHYEGISTSGEITDRGDSPYHGEVTTNTPIRVSPSGTAVLLGSGQIYNGTTLSLVATTGTSVVDAAWNGDFLYTLRSASGGTMVQAYSASTYAVGNSAQLTGSPVGIFPLSGDRLVVITSSQGYLQYWELAGSTLTQHSRIDTSFSPALSDFNSDGESDLVIQNRVTGERKIWLMDGTSFGSEVELGTIGIQWSIVGTGDFNGDGQTDLVWQNTVTGQRSIWLMNGTSCDSVADLGVVPVEWNIAGAGDFNRDGAPDIVWQNSVTGQRVIWLMNGTSYAGGVDLGAVPVEWSIAGAGDFNGDGQTDLIWQNGVTGQRVIWLMNGTSYAGGVDLGAVPVEWSIAGTGDFDGDGQTDLIWQKAMTGQRVIWLMNGTSYASGVDLGAVPVEWQIGGDPSKVLSTPPLNDFNGDGQTDLIWQNTVTGQRVIWLMNGASYAGGVDLGAVPVEWSIAGTGDFNGDGQTDLIWQNTVTGQRSIWLMNGTSCDSVADLGVVPVEWNIAGAGDFNRDDAPDIVWQNSVTGQSVIWLMNGTSYAGGVDLGALSVEWSIAGAGDFNGDGQTDLIWQNAVTGQRSIWQMNGTSYASVVVDLGVVPVEWSIAGAGDFNGDGQTDLIWRNTVTGQRVIWLMNGTSYADGVDLGTIPLEWQLCGNVPPKTLLGQSPSDFNGDDKSDLMWQNRVTGERKIWLMNGTNLESEAGLGIFAGEWNIAGSGDFNGDDQTDLIWRSTVTGQQVIWLMNGTSYASGVDLGTMPGVTGPPLSLEWQIAAVGDFNGDAKSDLVWGNTVTGERRIWLMNGISFASVADLGTIPVDWSIAGSGDFNGDGHADLLWQNTTTGQRAIWLMNGPNYASSVDIGTIPVEWSIAGTGDFNGDGQADLVWQNTVTGQLVIWLMNGTSYAGGVDLGTLPLEWQVKP